MPEDKRTLEPLLRSIRKAARIKGEDPEPDIKGLLESDNVKGLVDLKDRLWSRVVYAKKNSQIPFNCRR